MPLVSVLPLIRKARENGFAIPAFNIHNLETIQAVLEACEEMNSPVIIQTTPGTLNHAGVEYIGSIMKTAGDLYSIPIALHMDHCKSFDMIVACIRNNYTSVMIDGSHLPYKENVKLVKKVVDLAHAVNIQVEAEIGKIGGVEDDMFVSDKEAAFTDPLEAKEFAESTGIDSLAVAIGTAHGVYKGDPKLDFNRIQEISELIEQPLVLHGASGVSNESVRKAIELGMAKINIATELKLPMADAIRSSLNNPDESDPRNYMGAAKEAIKKVVKDKIELCKTVNFANEF